MDRLASFIKYQQSGPLDSAQMCLIPRNNSDADRTKSLQNAMEYLQGLDSDEAVEYLAKAILSWNENNNEIPLAVHKYITKQSANTIQQNDSHPNQNHLLQDSPGSSEPRNNKPGKSSSNETIFSHALSLQEIQPVERTNDNNDDSGLLAAIKFAHLLCVNGGSRG